MFYVLDVRHCELTQGLTSALLDHWTRTLDSGPWILGSGLFLLGTLRQLQHEIILNLCFALRLGTLAFGPSRSNRSTVVRKVLQHVSTNGSQRFSEHDFVMFLIWIRDFIIVQASDDFVYVFR